MTEIINVEIPELMLLKSEKFDNVKLEYVSLLKINLTVLILGHTNQRRMYSLIYPWNIHMI